MKKIILFLAFLVSYINYSQDGYLDTSFIVGTGFNGSPNSIITQNDDKIVVVGTFTTYKGVTCNRIVRLNPDGTIDSSFNPGSGTNNTIAKILQLNDGKFLIAGSFTSYDGISVNRIARLNNNGTLDVSFNNSSGPDTGIKALALQSDSKIVVVGTFQTFDGLTKRSIARLNSDGSLDTGFTPNIAMGVNPYAIAIQSDDKIIIGGNFSFFGGMSVHNIVRLDPNGTIDSTFNPGTGPNDLVLSIALRTDTKIIISGNFQTYNGFTVNYITQLNTDGSRDTNFTTGNGADSAIIDHVIQDDGKIIIVGSFASYDNSSARGIARLNSDGTKDAAFIQHINDIRSGFYNIGVNCVTLQNDQKIITGGTFINYNNVSTPKIARLTNSTLSVNENEFSASLKVFPNPSNAVFNINIDTNATLKVCDLAGKVIENKKIGFGNSLLDMSQYQSGIYFLKITTDNNQNKTIKVLKE